MKETFTTKTGVTIEVNVTEPERMNVVGEIMEVPKGTKLVAENKEKGIRYEYVNAEDLKQADFEGARPTNHQKELQKLILTEGFPYQEEVGEFWCGVPEVSDDEAFSCNQLVGWTEAFDQENGSCMGNIHQYALYLANRVKAEGWEAVADEADKQYKRYRIVKDHRSNSGFSYVGGCSDSNYYLPASDVAHYNYPSYRNYLVIVWVVLSR